MLVNVYLLRVCQQHSILGVHVLQMASVAFSFLAHCVPADNVHNAYGVPSPGPCTAVFLLVCVGFPCTGSPVTAVLVGTELAED